MKILVTGSNGFIGTNFTEILRDEIKDYEVYLVDIVPPKIPLNKNEKWVNVNILDKDALMRLFKDTKPQVVVHFAAETSCLPHLVLEDYKVNTTGSENLFDACQECDVQFLVNTSTQYVHQGDGQPISDTDFAPHTIYGESKIIAENMLRNDKYTFNWTIIRPTNVWGAWHLRYPYEFWKVVKEGKYFHPGNKKVMRSYGYVGNICLQILEIIKRSAKPEVSKQVFYVGERPINLYDWTNSFSLAIIKRKVIVIPTAMVYLLALFGSALQKVKINFPITISRFRSMTSENPAPMEKTMKILGEPRYSLDEGVKITTNWLFDFWRNS